MKKLFFSILLITTFVINSVGQEQWQVINTGYNSIFGKLQVSSSNTVYVFDSNSATLLRSFNGGTSWDSISLPADSTYFRYASFQFVNDNVGYVWGDWGSPFVGGTAPGLIKTTDKGKTWVSVCSDFMGIGKITGVHFLSPETGYCYLITGMDQLMGGCTKESYVTYDGGNSWHMMMNHGIIPEAINFVDFSDKMNGFATGTHPNLYFSKTDDGGMHWNTQQLNTFAGSGTGIKFFNSKTGVLFANDSIFKTTDGGLNWIKRKYPFAGNINACDMLNANQGFFGAVNSIYYTPDCGATWIPSFNDSNLFVSDIKMSGNTAYATTNNGRVLKLNLTNLGINAINVDAEFNFVLSPNPASKIVSINMEGIDSDNNTWLELVNTLGQSVLKQTISNNGLVTLNLSNVAKGVYECTIRSKENSVTKKLIVQ